MCGEHWEKKKKGKRESERNPDKTFPCFVQSLTSRRYDLYSVFSHYEDLLGLGLPLSAFGCFCRIFSSLEIGRSFVLSLYIHDGSIYSVNDIAVILIV